MPKIALISGEISGDQYASLLALQFKRIIPSIEIIGTGGTKLKKTGIRIIVENPLPGTFGISSVLKNLPQHLKYLKRCASALKEEKPDMIVFIDNPGFNLQLGKILPDLRKIYYIPPKIWAHDYQRIFLIRHFFESVITIFPFEKLIYEKEGIPAFYFGHPVIDLINEQESDEFFKKTFVKEKDVISGVFPGSRKEEIKYILPLLIEAGKLIQKKFKTKFIVSCAEESLYTNIKEIIEKNALDWEIWTGSAHNLARHSHIALAASGTMNLELALLGIPMIVFYRMSRFNYSIAKFVVQLRYVSPVNLIFGKYIVDEFIQKINWYKFQKVFSALFDSSGEKRKRQLESFAKLREILGYEKVSEKIAQFLLDRLK